MIAKESQMRYHLLIVTGDLYANEEYKIFKESLISENS